MNKTNTILLTLLIVVASIGWTATKQVDSTALAHDPYPAPIRTQEPYPAPVIIEPTPLPIQYVPPETVGTPVGGIETPGENPGASQPGNMGQPTFSELVAVGKQAQETAQVEMGFQKSGQPAGKPPRKTPWSIEVVDSTGNVGAYSSLELDAAGYAHVSYYDSTNDDLKYAYQDAGGWHIETVDIQGGGNTSLRLDNQGFAHILYTLGAAIQYAYQDASGWHIESVTASGKSIAMALDGSGAPHVS